MTRDFMWWLETWAIFIGAASLIINFVSLLLLFFYSVWRIEREMKRDGLPRPCEWDFTGYRTIVYWPYLFKSHEKLAKAAEKGIPDVYGLDPRQLLVYVRPIDRFIARLTLICGALFVIFGSALFLYQRYVLHV